MNQTLLQDRPVLRNDRAVGGPPLQSRRIFVPRMSFGASRCFAAALRGHGLDAHPFPASDERTLELGARYTSGDECFPQRITLGDALKVVTESGLSPDRLAFFMPGAPGPCRFGQYAPFLRRTLDQIGAQDVMILSPASGSGYDELSNHGPGLQRSAWRGLAAADVLRKALLRTRPYEIEAGDCDSLYDDTISEICAVLENPATGQRRQTAALRKVMKRAARRFETVPRRLEQRLLIGVVGEIFCRLNTFSNEDVIRSIEDRGGEAWIADICEWVYYTNLEQRTKWLPYAGKRWSLGMLGAWLKDRLQRGDEHALAAPFHSLFAGREEPARVSILTDMARPYLPADGVYGEMVMSTGKAIYLWSKGCDGIVDISPFTCMNGIVSEAVYPKVSREHGGIPIRVFYFDGIQSQVGRDLDIFMELAGTYRRKRSAISSSPGA